MPDNNKKTLSLCIPSTCVSPTVCRSRQQATHIAHQIARTALYYGASEIIIYDIKKEEERPERPVKKKIIFDETPEEEKPTGKKEEEESDAIELSKLLQFFITPSYLRKSVFGDLTKFQYAKKLPKLPGLPFQNHEKNKYLEGLSVEGRIGKQKNKKKKGLKSKKQLALESFTHYVNVGDKQVLKLADGQKVPLHSRVTVDTEKSKVVSPSEAYNINNSNSPWSNQDFGYTVRVAPTFGKTFVQCPYPEGYSYTTYIPCEEFLLAKHDSNTATEVKLIEPHNLKNPQHLLLVFGKWTDVNVAVKADNEELAQLTDASGLFDSKIAVNPNSRVEDAMLMSLAKIDGI